MKTWMQLRLCPPLRQKSKAVVVGGVLTLNTTWFWVTNTTTKQAISGAFSHKRR